MSSLEEHRFMDINPYTPTQEYELRLRTQEVAHECDARFPKTTEIDLSKTSFHDYLIEQLSSYSEIQRGKFLTRFFGRRENPKELQDFFPNGTKLATYFASVWQKEIESPNSQEIYSNLKKLGLSISRIESLEERTQLATIIDFALDFSKSLASTQSAKFSQKLSTRIYTIVGNTLHILASKKE